jgi:acyl-CoA thioesterase FadM
MDYQNLLKSDCALVVRSLEADYLKPLEMGKANVCLEILRIRCQKD